MLASIPLPDTDPGLLTAKCFPLTGLGLFSLLSLVVIFLFCIPRAAAQTSGLPPIDARAYILMNADTGAIIAVKNAYQPYAIASSTKLMTL